MPTACRLEETKRISRVIEIVQMIAVNPGRYLRRDLAGHFEISERMIQKDLDIVRHGLKFELTHTPAGYIFERPPTRVLEDALNRARNGPRVHLLLLWSNRKLLTFFSVLR